MNTCQMQCLPYEYMSLYLQFSMCVSSFSSASSPALLVLCILCVFICTCFVFVFVVAFVFVVVFAYPHHQHIVGYRWLLIHSPSSAARLYPVKNGSIFASECLMTKSLEPQRRAGNFGGGENKAPV